MRNIININKAWSFSKQAQTIPTALDAAWEVLDLPHSWNAIDGQDGGNDYYRGTAYYAKTINKSESKRPKRPPRYPTLTLCSTKENRSPA